MLIVLYAFKKESWRVAGTCTNYYDLFVITFLKRKTYYVVRTLMSSFYVIN